MLRLADITTGTVMWGIRPNENVRVEPVKWHGSDVVLVIHKDHDGVTGNQLLDEHI